MVKNRHTKTIPDKYGYRSVMDLYAKYLNSTKWDGRNFDELPYLGILYIDTHKFRDMIYYYESVKLTKGKVDMLKFKVLEVTLDHFTVAHYDDHHGCICLRDNIPYENYMIRSNELIYKN